MRVRAGITITTRENLQWLKTGMNLIFPTNGDGNLPLENQMQRKGHSSTRARSREESCWRGYIVGERGSEQWETGAERLGAERRHRVPYSSGVRRPTSPSVACMRKLRAQSTPGSSEGHPRRGHPEAQSSLRHHVEERLDVFQCRRFGFAIKNLMCAAIGPLMRGHTPPLRYGQNPTSAVFWYSCWTKGTPASDRLPLLHGATAARLTDACLLHCRWRSARRFPSTCGEARG